MIFSEVRCAQVAPSSYRHCGRSPFPTMNNRGEGRQGCGGSVTGVTLRERMGYTVTIYGSEWVSAALADRSPARAPDSSRGARRRFVCTAVPPPHSPLPRRFDRGAAC